MEFANKIRPLSHTVTPVFGPYSDYPIAVRVPMENGQVVKFVAEVEQPRPQFKKAMEVIYKWKKK